MANDSLTNFIVLLNRHLRRSKFLLMHLKSYFYNVACGLLSIFGTIDEISRNRFPLSGKRDDALWAILVQCASAADERIPPRASRTGRWPYTNHAKRTQSKEHFHTVRF